MDSRILLTGIIPLIVVTIGCILTVFFCSFRFEAVIGLLMITIPVILLCWYMLIRIDLMVFEIKCQGRVIQKSMAIQTTELKRRYDETMQQVIDLNTDLSRRIYR